MNEVGEVWREQWGRLLALLVAQYRRLDLAEECLADAFESAVRTWPVDGAPANPAGWLLTAARRRAVDRIRAEAVAARKQPLLVVAAELEQSARATMVDPGDLVLTDERLRLVFLCSHPALAPEAAAALTLRLVLGVATADIARLFLVSEPTMAARLTRAKRKLAVSGVAFRVPDTDQIGERLDVVASVAYLAFTSGYAPGSGPDVVRVELAGEAVRLTRLLRELTPGQAVFDLLLALMLIQHSRRDARVDPDGGLVLLPDQDRSRWHTEDIVEAIALLSGYADPPSWAADPTRLAASYRLQALAAAEHVAAATAAQTRWDVIAARYGELEALTGSPIVRLNRAVAVAEADGPEAGLALLDGLDALLPLGHRLPAIRAELLARLGRTAEAVASYHLALARCGNDAERAQLHARRAAIERSGGPPSTRR